jgi:3-isopropylmalate dehydrogenase
MNKNIAILKGDGIGPEVTQQAINVLQAIATRYNHNFIFTEGLVGADAIDKTGEPLPQATIEICLDSDAVLFGAIGHPKYDNDPTAKVRPEQGLLALRKVLQLFANIRPVNAYPVLHHLSPLKTNIIADVDFVIYRELTGGIYFGEKTTNEDGTVASDNCTYSKNEITRITHLAFKAAQQRRKKLTLVDKANVLETSRLWRKVVQEIAQDYSDVKVDFLFVDNAAMQIILNPKQFDVVLTENMFGDIISDEASVISGSIGMLPSASVGNTTAMFEPIHGSYPQATGKDIANPIGSILSAAMLLEHFNLLEEAALVRAAVECALQNKIITKDIEPLNFYFTSTVGEFIVDFINKNFNGKINNENIALRKSSII